MARRRHGGRLDQRRRVSRNFIEDDTRHGVSGVETNVSSLPGPGPSSVIYGPRGPRRDHRGRRRLKPLRRTPSLGCGTRRVESALSASAAGSTAASSSGTAASAIIAMSSRRFNAAGPGLFRRGRGDVADQIALLEPLGGGDIRVHYAQSTDELRLTVLAEEGGVLRPKAVMSWPVSSAISAISAASARAAFTTHGRPPPEG